MKRVPGIVVTNRQPLDEARIEGTGIEVFEVMKIYYAVEKDWEELRGWFDWLSEEQLRAALRFAELNPQAVRDRLRAEDEAAAELDRLLLARSSTVAKRP